MGQRVVKVVGATTPHPVLTQQWFSVSRRSTVFQLKWEHFEVGGLIYNYQAFECRFTRQFTEYNYVNQYKLGKWTTEPQPHAHTRAYTHTHTQAHTRIHAHTCTHANTRTNTHTHRHTCAHKTHTLTYTIKCICLFFLVKSSICGFTQPIYRYFIVSSPRYSQI